MSNFRSPSRGGNVVHNLDFPGLGRGGAARRAARDGQRRRSIAKEAPRPESSPAPRPAIDPEAKKAGGKPARIYVLPKLPRKEAATEPIKVLQPIAPNLEDSQARKQIDVLERRLAKMARLLDQRDTEIVSRSRVAEDTGVASIYRNVQGLDSGGDEAVQKKELMSSIFEANLKLREMVTSSAPSAE